MIASRDARIQHIWETRDRNKTKQNRTRNKKLEFAKPQTKADTFGTAAANPSEQRNARRGASETS
jgi:hypothetical protein